MSHVHRRFTDEQVRVLFQGYCQAQLRRVDVQDLLGIGKSRFFALLKLYHGDAQAFTVASQRQTLARLSAEIEVEIESSLLREEGPVEDPDSLCQTTTTRMRCDSWAGSSTRSTSTIVSTPVWAT